MEFSLIFGLLGVIWFGAAATMETHQSAVELGTKLILACRSPNGNASDLVWKQNGDKLLTREGRTISAHASGHITLTIDRVEETDNGTTFSCFSVNHDDELVAESTRLTVLAQDELPRGFPMIETRDTEESRFRLSHTGDVIRLPCYAAGDPRPDVVWFKDSAPIDWNDKRYLLGDRSADLFIRHVRLEDNAIYECVVRNIHGMAISQPFKLRVYEQPDPPLSGWKLWCFLSIFPTVLITCSACEVMKRRSSVAPTQDDSLLDCDGDDDDHESVSASDCDPLIDGNESGNSTLHSIRTADEEYPETDHWTKSESSMRLFSHA